MFVCLFVRFFGVECVCLFVVFACVMCVCVFVCCVLACFFVYVFECV